VNRTIPDDTIAAISTPPGQSGIGIVRLSGPASITIVASVFLSSSDRDVRTDKRQVFHGEIRANGNAVDEVLLIVMRAPHSYTREDVVEINCHGGPGPLNAVLQLVLEQGAHLAEAGEFTKRAFLNGRIDLVQAEAVIDRIQAQTRAGLHAAAAAANGALSQAIHSIADTLVHAKSLVEAEVDFVEEDMPALVTPKLKEQLEGTRREIERLLDTAAAGKLYREGTAVAIAGRPNVGKSSLFNALLRDARAIVTQHAGTTRDVLREVINIGGIPVRLTDTAGLRSTEDEVERLGVEAAREAVSQSALILFVVDSSIALGAEDHALAAELARLDVPMLLVRNKSDLPAAANPNELKIAFAANVELSATEGDGLHALEDCVAELLTGGANIAPGQGIITRIHQEESLRRSHEALSRLLENYDASAEFLALDLDEAIRALGEITGETTPDDILERIFASFCIGK
jgi:tRNA modification GTPase